MSEKEKIVLAYSGGLDTSVIIPWLKENYDCEVIAVCVDVGQGDETLGLEKKAVSSGASKLYLIDATEEFVTDFIFPTVKAGAIYEGKYLLGTSMARPLIAKKLVEIAKKENAAAICHGATGKGNDQVRFELTIKSLAPNLRIIAPWRHDAWKIKSREEAVVYLEERNLPVPVKKGETYSRDKNIWHLSHEGQELENPAIAPDLEKVLQICVTPEKAPDTAQIIELTFEKGVPVALDGKRLSPVELISALNEVGAKHGVGVSDLVENRVVGIKSRGVYETPGGDILYYAHRELEYLCLDKQTAAYKQVVGVKIAELIYSGEWYTPLLQSLFAFVDKTQEMVTGKVRLKLYKGNIMSNGSESAYSLYDEGVASFATGDSYSHHDATGFINLFGLSLKMRALMKERNGEGGEV